MTLKIASALVLVFLGLGLFQFAVGQALLKLNQQNNNNNIHNQAEQDRACAEFESCLSERTRTKDGAPAPSSDIHMLDLGPNVVDFKVDNLVCAHKSGCKREQRAFCQEHMGANGTIEVKTACLISWLSDGVGGETDANDPIMSTFCNFERDQKLACSNYEKCMELPNERFKTLRQLPQDEAVSHIVSFAKHATCASNTNCIKKMKDVCNRERTEDKDHKMGKIVALACAFTLFSDETTNPSGNGSRSLGGKIGAPTTAAGTRQEILSEFCHDSKDGVCSVAS